MAASSSQREMARVVVPELLTGAALGVLLQELYSAIKRCAKPSVTRVSTLWSAVESLAVGVHELSRKFSQIDGRWCPEAREEALKLRELLEKTHELMLDCTMLRWWNLRQKRRFTKRLQELAAFLEQLQIVDLGFWADQIIMDQLLVVQAQLIQLTAQLDCLS